MTTATAPPKIFRSQRPDDPDSRNAQMIRDIYWTMFGEYAYPGLEVDDFDLTVEKVQSATSWNKGFVKNAILGHAVLQELPRLRALQSNTRVMDIGHLTATYTAIEELGPDPDEEALALIDEILVDTFTPKRNNQQVPQRKTVTDRIRAAIKRLDKSRGYNAKKRDEREKDTSDTFRIDCFSFGGEDRASIEIFTNPIAAGRVGASVKAVAREHGISMPEAALKLLCGEIAGTSVTPVLNVYSPKDREEGDPVFLPGLGWTDAETTAAFEDWLASTDHVERDLDAAAVQKLSGYAPNEAMRHAVIARDGTCIYPGCNRAAQQCQLDHRIPYGEGGETTVDNLFALCQHHHNLKTDRRGFYIPDPVTGDIVWLYADGTYEICTPEGLLHEQVTPTNPRWKSSLANVRKNRARAAEFYAKGHRILDIFDDTLDEEAATTAIEELEQEYSMVFPFAPETPWEEPLPPEPDDEEPPFPDPEDYYPEENPFHEQPKIDLPYFAHRFRFDDLKNLVLDIDGDNFGLAT